MSKHKIRSQIILATGLSHSNKLRKIQKKIGQVEVDLGVSQIWGLLWLCWGPNGPIWSGSKAVLGTTHVVEQLLFCQAQPSPILAKLQLGWAEISFISA